MATYREPLSERELQILRLVSTGASNREVAYRLGISTNTVKVHLRNIFAKLGAESRTEATMIAVREGWVTVPTVPPTPPAAPVRDVPPLPWHRRITLVTAALVVTAAAVVSWPRTPGTQRPTNGVLPAQAGEGAESVVAVGSDSHWTERAQMPTRRTGLALAAWQGRLYAFGGEGPEGVTGAVEVYDTETDTWTHAAQKPTPAAYLSAAVVDGRIYVPGGCVGPEAATAVVEVYEPEADMWTEGTPLPVPLCAYALAEYEGRIYVFGGTDGEQALGRAFVYDPTEGRWEELAPMPEPRTVAAAAALGETIYVVGGYREGRELSACSAYEPATDRWHECAALTVARSGPGLVALSGQLYAIGGGRYLGFNERYDPRTDRWTAVETPLTGAWQSPGVALLGMTIYTVGGWSQDYLSLNLAFEPLPFHIFIPVTER